MGTETDKKDGDHSSKGLLGVKLNNPLMGTETNKKNKITIN